MEPRSNTDFSVWVTGYSQVVGGLPTPIFQRLSISQIRKGDKDNLTATEYPVAWFTVTGSLVWREFRLLAVLRNALARARSLSANLAVPVKLKCFTTGSVTGELERTTGDPIADSVYRKRAEKVTLENILETGGPQTRLRCWLLGRQGASKAHLYKNFGAR